jgi:hypothetical protein
MVLPMVLPMQHLMGQHWRVRRRGRSQLERLHHLKEQRKEQHLHLRMERPKHHLMEQQRNRHRCLSRHHRQ